MASETGSTTNSKQRRSRIGTFACSRNDTSTMNVSSAPPAFPTSSPTPLPAGALFVKNAPDRRRRGPPPRLRRPPPCSGLLPPCFGRPPPCFGLPRAVLVFARPVLVCSRPVLVCARSVRDVFGPAFGLAAHGRRHGGGVEPPSPCHRRPHPRKERRKREGLWTSGNFNRRKGKSSKAPRFEASRFGRSFGRNERPPPSTIMKAFGAVGG